MNPVLEAQQLCVDRGGRRVLEQMNFSVSEGEVFALLGGNGAGKSTALLTFLGFLAPASGTAQVQGRSVHEDISAVHRQVAYLPEAASLYPHLNARENLDYFLALANSQRSAADVEATLDTVRLAPEARARRLDDYSKGMRQKVGIALALLRNAPILMLDEPTSGLDPAAIDEFNALILDLAQQGKTVLMVTHDVYGACQVAQRIGLLQQGQLVGTFEANDGEPISAATVHEAFAEHHR